MAVSYRAFSGIVEGKERGGGDSSQERELLCELERRYGKGRLI